MTEHVGFVPIEAVRPLKTPKRGGRLFLAMMATTSGFLFGCDQRSSDSGRPDQSGNSASEIQVKILPTSEDSGNIVVVTPMPQADSVSRVCETFLYDTSYGEYKQDPSLSFMNSNPEMQRKGETVSATTLRGSSQPKNDNEHVVVNVTACTN